MTEIMGIAQRRKFRIDVGASSERADISDPAGAPNIPSRRSRPHNTLRSPTFTAPRWVSTSNPNHGIRRVGRHISPSLAWYLAPHVVQQRHHAGHIGRRRVVIAVRRHLAKVAHEIQDSETRKTSTGNLQQRLCTRVVPARGRPRPERQEEINPQDTCGRAAYPEEASARRGYQLM